MKDKEQPMGSEGAAAAEVRSESPAEAEAGSRSGPPDTLQLDSADQAILDAIRADRHREALTLCARQHGTAVGRLCLALLGSQAEADDLTQETLLSAHDAFDSYRGEGSLRAWLLGIARRQCARHLERGTRRESKLRLVRPVAEQVDGDELLLKRQRAEFARTALAEVRPSEREALLLRYVSELSYRDVGQACGIEEAAARKRVSRAIAKLRSVLADKE
jgi:RNA polymerase sigma-70 factor (ECF subfamily)